MTEINTPTEIKEPCPICYDDLDIVTQHKFGNCSHCICDGCASTLNGQTNYQKVYVRELDLYVMKCPVCRSPDKPTYAELETALRTRVLGGLNSRTRADQAQAQQTNLQRANYDVQAIHAAARRNEQIARAAAVLPPRLTSPAAEAARAERIRINEEVIAARERETERIRLQMEQTLDYEASREHFRLAAIRVNAQTAERRARQATNLPLPVPVLTPTPAPTRPTAEQAAAEGYLLVEGWVPPAPAPQPRGGEQIQDLSGRTEDDYEQIGMNNPNRDGVVDTERDVNFYATAIITARGHVRRERTRPVVWLNRDGNNVADMTTGPRTNGRGTHARRLCYNGENCRGHRARTDRRCHNGCRAFICSTCNTCDEAWCQIINH